MVGKCERSSGRVSLGGVVMYKRGSSNRRVFSARRVEQKRRGADCGIGVGLIEGERSAAKPSIKAPRGNRKKRIPTGRCIGNPGRKIFERISPFCRRECRITPIRWRDDSLRLWQKRHESQH